MASIDKKLGYVTQSFTMESFNSSSVKPQNGTYDKYKYIIIIIIIMSIKNTLLFQQAFHK